ncbi:MAG: peptidoglycan DD-metalloendopeptidase family protein [Pseudomonadota bacterium]
MKFPLPHLLLISFLSLSLVAFAIAKLSTSSPAEHKVTQLELPAEVSSDAVSGTPAISTQATHAEPLQPTQEWTEVNTQVKPGDNLALIFKRHGLTPRDVYLVTQTPVLGTRLKNIYPGHTMVLQLDDNKTLMGLTYTTGPLDSLHYERQGDAFTAQQITQEPDRIVTYKRGVIDHSLFIASQRAGLSDNLTMRLAQIFQWDVDFVLDIRPEDEFHVLYEELYLDGERIGDGNILAAEFVNQGESFKAIAYEDNRGRTDFYTPSGESMRKAFLRAPVEFSRISSNFNLRRVHPLFKTVRPHRGIDYAAPKGTPILAAGDGKVTAASKTKPNGNYVVIQHGEQFVTKYLHLSKFARGVKRGAKVKQGQVIGYVGATGWATAPHLHYEFLVNGVHQNPRTVSLPDAEPIDQEELQRFQVQTAQYSALLDNYKSHMAAMAVTNPMATAR